MCIFPPPSFGPNTLNILLCLALASTVLLSACSGNSQRKTQEARYAELEKRQLENLESEKLQRQRSQGARELNPILLTEAERKQKELDDRYQRALKRAAARSDSVVPFESSDSAEFSDAPIDSASNTWTAVTLPHPLSNVPECAMLGEPDTNTAHGRELSAEIVVTKTAIFVTSNTNYHQEALFDGFSIDEGKTIPFDEYQQKTAIVNKRYEKVLIELLSGKQLTVQFTPLSAEGAALPVTFSFNLASFNAANQALYRCDGL